MIRRLKLYSKITFAILGMIVIFNTLSIITYSYKYSEEKSDVAIVLGAASTNGKLSPVFRERVNHSIYLINNDIVDYIIFTGGLGEKETISDSRAAMNYAISKGVKEEQIFIEESSSVTIQNLRNAKLIMTNNDFKTALIVSDPLHMKRSMKIANTLDISCKPSPTPTTMYKSTSVKFKSLLYESFFYNLNFILFRYY